MIVAIDGPAGAGKSTTARAVAQKLGFSYINTGAMYRAVALFAREKGFSLPASEAQIVALAQSLPLRFSDGGTRLWSDAREVSGEISAPEVAEMASQVAALPALREIIVARQRELGEKAEKECGGAVLEGRDIQTVVFPDAKVKIFLTASPAERARRRLEQWEQTGRDGDLGAAAKDVETRDGRDSSREASPLQAAPDATHVLTDGLSPDEVVEKIVALAQLAR